MRTITFGLLFSSFITVGPACQDEHDDRSTAPRSSSSVSQLVPQIMPPLDLKAPPNDAMKTASGLALKKLTSNDRGVQPQRGDTALVHYTGWRQGTGETFFTTKAVSQPMALDVARASPAFSDALQRLRKGERAMLWVPPSDSGTEALVYEVELLDVVPPPGPAPKGLQAGSASAAAARQDPSTAPE